jgi:hypothetical protein
MEARHRLGHRFAGLVSDALILVAPSLLSARTACYFGWLALRQRERSFS